ncbi:MAG: rhomboid family intramembrane serine protease [Chelatococcus sp.]|jgi:membrane associated rhomboid family serine protease|nr:rhomboid family intramembrane serine protease [Chelatococcus sp.]
MPLNAFTPHRPAREPMVNAPLAVVLLIGLLVVIHIARLAISEEADFRVLVDFAFVPARLTVAVLPSALDTILAAAAARGSQHVLLAQLLLQEGAKPWTLITHAFLHGSWTHLIFNALWLLAFGSPVARRFGTVRFFVLLAICAVVGAVFYTLFNPYGTIPMIGASGAISGVMAAACRFVFQPGMPWLAHQPGMAEYAQAQSWREIMTDRRAMSFIAVWFGVNIVFGLAASPLGLADGGIAWEAHIGGFVAGFLLFPLLDPASRRRR